MAGATGVVVPHAARCEIEKLDEVSDRRSDGGGGGSGTLVRQDARVSLAAAGGALQL